MTIHYTSVYQLAYADVDTPAVQLGAVTQQVAQALEAALIRGGVAPPAAQDLATLAGRVSTLENGLVQPRLLGLTPSFTNLGGFAPAQYWSRNGEVKLLGALKVVNAIAANGTAAVAGIPVGFRPQASIMVDSLANGTVVCRLDINTDGTVNLVATGGAIAANAYLPVNVFWPVLAAIA